MPDTQIHRLGPQAGGPSMCLRGQTTEKDPRQESPLSACVGAATEKDWPKRPPDAQLQEARKKTDRVNYCCGGSPCPCILGAAKICASQAAAPPSRFTLTGAELLRANKSLASMHTGSLWSCPTLCNPVDCGLPGFSVGVGVGVLQARILECVGQYWLPHPSRALYFLLP